MTIKLYKKGQNVSNHPPHISVTRKTGYSIGDIGPGGGYIFYINLAGFQSGPTLSTTCKYLEAAPLTGTNAWTDATYAWSGNTTGSITTSFAIGAGYKNTLTMVAQSSTANKAGTICRAYTGPNNLTDWFLPSTNELVELYNQRASVGGVKPSTYYWASTEFTGSPFNNGSWSNLVSTVNGGTGPQNKSTAQYVRPIRAF